MGREPKCDWESITPDDPIIAGAWGGFLRFAIGHDGILKRYKEETGKDLMAKLSPIEQMIDESTGHDEQTVFDFAKWATETMWGEV